MRKLVVAAACAVLACAPNGPSRPAARAPAGPGPSALVLATFDGSFDPATGELAVAVHPRGAPGPGAGDHLASLVVTDPDFVTVANDQAVAPWANAVGHCTDPAAASGGRAVLVTVHPELMFPAALDLGLTGLYVQLTNLSDPFAASCNSSPTPPWIVDDPGFGLWALPAGATVGAPAASIPLAFSWTTGARSTFRGRILAFASFAHYDYAAADAPWVSAAGPAARRDTTIVHSALGLLYGTATGLDLFDVASLAPTYPIAATVPLPAPPVSLAADGSHDLLWFTAEAAPGTAPQIGCLTAGLSGPFLADWPGGGTARGIVPDPTYSAPAVLPARAWFVDGDRPTVGSALCAHDFAGSGTVALDVSFTPGAPADAIPRTPRFVAVGGDDNLYVTAASGDVVVHAKTGAWLATLPGAGSCPSPMNIVAGPDGWLYVSDWLDGNVCAVSPAGALAAMTVIATGPGGGGPMTFDRHGNLWMVRYDDPLGAPRALGQVVPGAGNVIRYPLTSGVEGGVATHSVALLRNGVDDELWLTALDTAPGTASGLRGLALPTFFSVSIPAAITLSFGSTTSGTIDLVDPAPAAGLTFTLTSSAPGLVQVPATVAVLPGALSASFTVTGTAPTSAAGERITATFAGAKSSSGVWVFP